MVRHFMQDGYKVYVYNRTKAKTDSLVQEGANWCDTPKELVKQVDVVMTMVGYPHDVEEVYFGIDGILENANEGTIAIDFTTSTPTLAKRINETGKSKNIYTLDAPVSGEMLVRKKQDSQLWSVEKKKYMINVYRYLKS